MTTKVFDTDLLPSYFGCVTVTGLSYLDGFSASTTGGTKVTLTGSNFIAGATVYVDNTLSIYTEVISSTSISFIAPAMTSGQHVVSVLNANGSYGKLIPGIQYAPGPTWNTSSNLGVVYECFSSTIVFSASSTSSVTYSLIQGSLPNGLSLNSSTGALTGTFPVTSQDTTYVFQLSALDQTGTAAIREFTLLLKHDIVTWQYPTSFMNIEYITKSNVSTQINATALSGASVTYSMITSFSEISLVEGYITGTVITVGNYDVTLTATSVQTSRTSTITFTLKVFGNPGQQLFDTPGTFWWTPPEGVSSISVVCIGGGAGAGINTGSGGGGGLGWKNNIAVTPGTLYQVIVGAGGKTPATTVQEANGGDSYFNSPDIVCGYGGHGVVTLLSKPNTTVVGGAGGNYVGDGGGHGGYGGSTAYTGNNIYSGGGGGAGGYIGTGGSGQYGGYISLNATEQNSVNGSGGGGGGGAGGKNDDSNSGLYGGSGGGGGGTGVYGKGVDGQAGANGTINGSYGLAGTNGSATGSGTNGATTTLGMAIGGSGGLFGGGVASSITLGSSIPLCGTAANGAVRIIWGANRAFPNTNTGDM